MGFRVSFEVCERIAYEYSIPQGTLCLVVASGPVDDCKKISKNLYKNGDLWYGLWL